MSTEIVGTNPESKSEEETSSVEESSPVEEKTSSLFQSARLSFEDGDYSASMKSLEDIPDTLRNDEMKELLERSKQLRAADNQFQLASRAFDAKDYEQTILSIEKIPEADRSNACKNLLKNARVIPLVKLGREKLNGFRYNEVIEMLDPVPKEDRSDELVEILQNAYTNKRRMIELDGEIEAALKEADEHCSAAKYTDAISLLEELLALDTSVGEVRKRIREISELKNHFLERDRLFQEAKVAFKEKEYESCEESLKKIPERIRKGDAIELLDLAVRYRRRSKVLSEEIVEAIEESNFSSLETFFSELGELQNDPYSKISQLLEEEILFRSIFEMAKLSSENLFVSEVLHGFLNSLDSPSVIGFLQSTKESFSEYFTEDCKILLPKIQIVLQELPEYSPERNREALKAIGSISKHIGQLKTRWDGWNRFWALLEQLFDCGHDEWTTKELWFESEKTLALDTASQELAELSRQLLSTSEKDSWALLQNLAGHDLKFTLKPLRRAFQKIELYLNKGKWNLSSLVPLTKKRIVRGILLTLGVTALASVVQILMTFVFGIGGFLGFGMIFFLAGLWTAFYFALHKIM